MNTSEWARKIKERDNDTCQECGKSKEEIGKRMHSHHIKRLVDGGTNTLENGVLLCAKCHRGTHKNRASNGNGKITIFSVRMETETHEKLKRIAKEEGRSLNKQIIFILEQAIGRKNIVVGEVKK